MFQVARSIEEYKNSIISSRAKDIIPRSLTNDTGLRIDSKTFLNYVESGSNLIEARLGEGKSLLAEKVLEEWAELNLDVPLAIKRPVKTTVTQHGGVTINKH